MGKMIDQTKSTFIKGWLITYNVLISFECQHWLINMKKGKDGHGAVKVDMSKTYDGVEWDYLEAFMKTMDFLDKFYSLIKHL